jgi:hypothetical protein
MDSIIANRRHHGAARIIDAVARTIRLQEGLPGS